MAAGAGSVAAVIGHPVTHSRSPRIFRAAFAEVGLDWQYLALDVLPAAGPEAVQAGATLGLVGLNVTMPHKQAVAATVDVCSDAARALGAVNCVTYTASADHPTGRRSFGDNTDGPGFLAGLAHDGVSVQGLTVAVLGAGGAARAIIRSLGEAGASSVAVLNRTPERAADAAGLAGLVGVVGDREHLRAADLVVNATSVGMGDDGGIPCDPDDLGAHQVVVDAVYHPLTTPLLEAASERGARPLDGLGMLVGQACIAFERWTGLDAPVAVMRQAAR